MNLMTIGQVSKSLNISTRTLRYYEQIGLLTSQKKEDYTYRIYNETAVRRLQQIIILRKLRIPLKQIGIIFQDREQTRLAQILQDNIIELDNELTALTTIRSILRSLASHLNDSIQANVKIDLFQDSDLIRIVESLSLSKINFKEERSMAELEKASETLNKLTDIRILYLAPCTVASSHYIGVNPEDVSGCRLDEFVRGKKLNLIKPDLRLFGFNNPCPQDNQDEYGYEFWITIPDDMDVPYPLVKKHFNGGLYAAHCIKMGDFHEWKMFYESACNNVEFDMDAREPLGMNGGLEEHLNGFSYYESDKDSAQFKQVDLLIPIKYKQA